MDKSRKKTASTSRTSKPPSRNSSSSSAEVVDDVEDMYLYKVILEQLDWKIMGSCHTITEGRTDIAPDSKPEVECEFDEEMGAYKATVWRWARKADYKKPTSTKCEKEHISSGAGPSEFNAKLELLIVLVRECAKQTAATQHWH